jgi:hypothetical protein
MKTNLANWLSALCAILLIVLLVLQTEQKSQLETLRQEHQAFVSETEQRQQETRDAVSKLADQVGTVGTNLESRLVQDEQQANEKLGETMKTVQQNTAVMHRALGKVIPVELPVSLTNQLAALEARIADENSWPKDSTNTDAMVAELRDLIRQIPPWAEEDYLPRLNALRWAVQSLELIQVNANTQGEDLDATAEAYANQLSIRPDGGSTNIAAVLTSRQQEVASLHRDNALNEAKKQLDLKTMTDGLGTWQQLSEWTNDPIVGSNALELRKQLHSRLLRDGIASFIESSQDNLKRLSDVTNLFLRQAGYARLLDSVTDQRMNVLQQPDVSQDLRSNLEVLYKIVETNLKKEADEQNLGYQRWALEQIHKFNAAYDAIKAKRVTERKELADKLHGKSIFFILGVDLTMWRCYYTLMEAIAYEKIPLNYKAIAGAMQTFLLPISSGYLDPAVSRLYNNAFDKGWNELEKTKPLQTDVAEWEGFAIKKTPQNYQEEQ